MLCMCSRKMESIRKRALEDRGELDDAMTRTTEGVIEWMEAEGFSPETAVTHRLFCSSNQHSNRRNGAVLL